MVHEIKNLNGKVDLPTQFTFPFSYTPHPLAVRASELVMNYLQSQTQWHEELMKGKMFGVLVVQMGQNLGFIAAFSGQIANSYQHDYFVPPIYDLNQPSSYFRKEEANISRLSTQIEEGEKSNEYLKLNGDLRKDENEYSIFCEHWKRKIEDAKKKRDDLRKNDLSAEEESLLIKESQFLKAEFKREKSKKIEAINLIQTKLNSYNSHLEKLRKERRLRSVNLQKWLFEQFEFLNARGERKSLNELFGNELPPSGAGECAAPKMLQYAYKNHLKPLCMCEFWWGKSPVGIIRRHGAFYPSCNAKCKSILSFMLEGLNVEQNPLLKNKEYKIKIVYEDDSLIVADKPSGVLSVPGIDDSVVSMETALQRNKNNPGIKAVHRLDMATSGIMIFAKNYDTLGKLQRQFESRQVKKSYVALLDGEIVRSDGRIELPLCLDYENRPYQMVDFERGKRAVTYFQSIERNSLGTKVLFMPETGRTHQLRVHAAHPLGLNCPIKGDELYGKKSDRLYLQSFKIEFRHPVTCEVVKFEVPFEF